MPSDGSSSYPGRDVEDVLRLRRGLLLGERVLQTGVQVDVQLVDEVDRIRKVLASNASKMDDLPLPLAPMSKINLGGPWSAERSILKSLKRLKFLR
jgi:hypothetical protein